VWHCVQSQLRSLRANDSHPDGEGFKQPAAFHVERARQHIDALASGEDSEQHLAHAATRLLMALTAEQSNRKEMNNGHQELSNL
jgi:hypothetical protein